MDFSDCMNVDKQHLVSLQELPSGLAIFYQYFGCIDNPECDFMVWQKPSSVMCSKCGQIMLEKGNKLACSNETCGNIMDKN